MRLILALILLAALFVPGLVRRTIEAGTPTVLSGETTQGRRIVHRDTTSTRSARTAVSPGGSARLVP